MRIKYAPQVSSEAEVIVRAAVHLPSLLPHEEHRGAWTPFPAKDRVGAELLDVESTRISRIRLEPILILLGAWICELAPVGVFAAGNERLAVELEREVRRGRVVDAGG